MLSKLLIFLICFGFGLLAPSDAYRVKSLKKDDYDEQTAGKTVFIKFFAPWCAFCKRLAPLFGVAGEKLAEAWDGHEVGLVAEVDCTAPEEKKLCKRFDIQNFPTLMYGDPSMLEEYDGGTSFAELSEFAEENLVPLCSPRNLELCDTATREIMSEYLSMSVRELREMIVVEGIKIKEATERYWKEIALLQKQYDEAAEKRDEEIAAIMDGGLNMMTAVINIKKQEALAADKSEL